MAGRSHSHSWIRSGVIVLVAVVLAAGSALTMSLLSTARYRASAEVMVLVRVRSIESEALVATSSDVAAEVRGIVGDAPDLVVEVVGDDVLRFTAESTNAQTAATAANLHADVYAAPRGDTVEVIERATTPSDPYEPQTVRNVLLAAAAGLLIGLVAALVLRRFDPTIRSARRLTAFTRLPNLGVIPRIRPVDAGADGPVTERDPTSVQTDATAAFRSAFESAVADAGVTVVLVTSPAAGEGSSSAAATLATSSAVAGRKVVLVDARLADPRVHDLLGLGYDVGLSSVVQGDAQLQDAVQRSTFERNLAVLTAGPPPADPAEVWESDRLVRALDALASAADLVVIDAPPILTASDAVVALARHADVVLLSATTGVSDRRAWAEAAEHLTAADAVVVGTVLCRREDGAVGVTEPSKVTEPSE